MTPEWMKTQDPLGWSCTRCRTLFPCNLNLCIVCEGTEILPVKPPAGFNLRRPSEDDS